MPASPAWSSNCNPGQRWKRPSAPRMDRARAIWGSCSWRLSAAPSCERRDLGRSARNGMADVMIIGGGVIGLTAAFELAERGLQVTVLDQQQPGREASWAGAGILPPAYPGDPNHPLAQLARATHPLWPQLSERLREEVGIDNGFRACGGINFSPDGTAPTLSEEIRLWQQAGAAVESLDADAVGSLEPSISPEA